MDGSVVEGNYGAYMLADYMVLPEGSNDGQGLGAFLQLGFAPGDHNFVDMYTGGGIHYTGLLKNRDEDVLALAFAQASFNNNLVNVSSGTLLGHETAIEFSYKVVLGEHFEIQPDLQYIINTGGDATLDNSFVGLLRTVVSF